MVLIFEKIKFHQRFDFWRIGVRSAQLAIELL